MPKPAKGARLGSGPDHEKHLLSGLASALIREERIRTTHAKARRVRPLAERLITLGKDGGIHARRQVLQVIPDRDLVHRLFDEVAPRFEDRNGGYTRILKLGPRKGDAAPMVILELVEGASTKTRSATTESASTRRRAGVLRRRRGEAAKAPEAEATRKRGSKRGPEPEAPSDEGERASAEREQTSPESSPAAEDADPASKD